MFGGEGSMSSRRIRPDFFRQHMLGGCDFGGLSVGLVIQNHVERRAQASFTVRAKDVVVAIEPLTRMMVLAASAR